MKTHNDSSNYDNSYGAVKSELYHIRSIDPLHPGQNFNNNPLCFAEYCNMQANTFSEWTQQAEEMRQARDIADPEYRTNARNNGHSGHKS